MHNLAPPPEGAHIYKYVVAWLLGKSGIPCGFSFLPNTRSQLQRSLAPKTRSTVCFYLSDVFVSSFAAPVTPPDSFRSTSTSTTRSIPSPPEKHSTGWSQLHRAAERPNERKFDCKLRVVDKIACCERAEDGGHLKGPSLPNQSLSLPKCRRLNNSCVPPLFFRFYRGKRRHRDGGHNTFRFSMDQRHEDTIAGTRKKAKHNLLWLHSPNHQAGVSFPLMVRHTHSICSSLL